MFLTVMAAIIISTIIIFAAACFVVGMVQLNHERIDAWMNEKRRQYKRKD
jgi:hypothetical protein